MSSPRKFWSAGTAPLARAAGERSLSAIDLSLLPVSGEARAQVRGGRASLLHFPAKAAAAALGGGI